MMKFRFISKETKEEIPHVFIDGFVYLLSNEEINENEWMIDEGINAILKCNVNNFSRDGYSKVIFTNNPSLTDIPQIQLEEDVNKLAGKAIKETRQKLNQEFIDKAETWKKGYQKHHETHPFSVEDMIEFGEWLINISIETSTMKEAVEIWQEQRIKTIEV